MNKTFIIIIFLLSFFIKSNGQLKIAINEHTFEGKPTIGFVGGLSGFKQSDLELGIALNLVETRPENKTITKPFFGASISGLYNFNNTDLIGESFSIWLNGLILFGINQNFYKKADKQTWGLKPFAGFEVYGFSISYGYNIFLTENHIEELKHHNFTIRYFLPILKI